MYEDHLKSCSYCQKGSLSSKPKPTISIKSASSYRRQKKLSELGAIIMGTSYPSLEPMFQTKTKGASEVDNKPRRPDYLERELKLRELGKMIRGY